MPAAKLYKSLLTNCGVQLRLHQRQLRKAAVGLTNETGLWPLAPDEFKSGGGVSVRRRNFFIVTVNTVWPGCCLQVKLPCGVGATVCGYALGGSDVIDTRVIVALGSHTH